jgi:hypothetical protein
MPEVPWPVALLLIFTGLQRRERSFGAENASIHLPEDLVRTTDSQFRFDTSYCCTNRLRVRSFCSKQKEIGLFRFRNQSFSSSLDCSSGSEVLVPKTIQFIYLKIWFKQQTLNLGLMLPVVT